MATNPATEADQTPAVESPPLRSVSLTDAELLLLDGKCRPEVQQVVESARERLAAMEQYSDLTPKEAAFIADAMAEARENLKLVCQRVAISSCRICGESGGYAVYKRAGRYHRKGETNYDKPLSLAGVELAIRVVRMKGYPTLGCCTSCFEKIKPDLLEALKPIEAELPEALTGEPPRFKRYDNRFCTKCGWEGHEGQMRMLPALFGGKYPGGCPECDASNVFMGSRDIEARKGYTLDATPTEKPR